MSKGYSRLQDKTKNKTRESADQLRARVAINIRLFRRNSGMTQEQLAKRAKLSGRYLAELEREGGQNITIDTLGHLANALNVEVSDLIDGVQPMVQKKTGSVRATIALLENYCSFLESMEGAQPEKSEAVDASKTDSSPKKARRRK